MEDQTPTLEEKLSAKSHTELIAVYNEAIEAAKQADEEVEESLKFAENYTDEEIRKRRDAFNGSVVRLERLKAEVEGDEARKRAREGFKLLPTNQPGVRVREPDMYTPQGEHSFFTDLYRSELKGDPTSRERIGKHQSRELEKFAITTGTLGGIIPPAYLIDLYAKASRNGRVFADQCNGQPLPDVGMSIILPRLTVGLSAGSQVTESTALTTSDPTEVDLTVPVRTIGGYSPVSRQAIERAAYSDTILFEDLVARYWAQLDTQAINGAGTSGTFLGLLNTSGISTSTASTATISGVWPKIADLIQQINVAVGGLGYTADKIVMHPRRWGFFEAALDTNGRPLIVPSGNAYNAMGTDSNNAPDYGLVGQMHGLPVYTDANIPTTLGSGTNQDPIIVMASRVVHLFERSSDPVTLSFEQQAGTSLQVQLIAYGYAAFTAGRYPAASGTVNGVGLVPPTF